MAIKILVVLTNVGVVPATDKPTGWDLVSTSDAFSANDQI